MLLDLRGRSIPDVYKLALLSRGCSTLRSSTRSFFVPTRLHPFRRLVRPAHLSINEIVQDDLTDRDR